MRRRKLLALAATGSLATVAGIRILSPIERWAEGFGARRDSTGTWNLALSKSGPAILAGALHALDALSDGPLSCAGSEIRGSVSGAAFLLRLA